METAVIFGLVLVASSIAAGSAMARRGEPFRLWAALGLAMGPLVVPFARQHLANRTVASSLVPVPASRRMRRPTPPSSATAPFPLGTRSASGRGPSNN